MYINGHDNKADVIQNVIENIDDGLLANAKDMLNQLKEIELDVVEYSTKKDEKNLYKIVDKLEQRITTQEHSHTFLESRVDGLDKDIDAITKVLTKMKSELYYTQKEDQDLKDEIEKAEIKRDQDAKAARDNAEAREIMKNVTNKEDK